jgi:ABC-type nitrate/sulfonate/bicarbonate transport system permease component
MAVPVAVSRPPGRRERRQRTSWFPPLRGLLPLLVGVVLWQLLQRGLSPYFPRPSLWYDAVHRLFDAGQLPPALGQTTRSFAVALALAIGIGSLVGIVIGRVRAVDRALSPLLEFCRVLPPAAVVPLFVLIAGYTDAMKVEVTVFGALWPILLQARRAARGISPPLLDTARSLGLSRWGTIHKIILPAVAPAIFVGVRIAAPIVLILVLLVEILTRVSGLGALIAAGQVTYQSAQVYGLVVITGFMGLVLNAIVESLERRVLRYRPQRTGGQA